MIVSPPRIDLPNFSIADVPANPEPFRLINRIPILDNGEPLVDLRETNPELSFGIHCLPCVRESVAEALTIAFQNLSEHLDLRVHTALRTLDQQAEMYWSNYERAKREHPNWPESVVRRMTNRFFAPPDTKAPPGHCTGAAVDIGLLIRETGEGLDVRSPLEGWKAAPTAAMGLGFEAAENRRLLCHIMHSAGFSNCRDEFWHWSIGDSAWAVRVGAGTACYGFIEPPTGATRVTGPRISLAPYNSDWTKQFEEIRSSIESKLGTHLHGIEHVGSTSVTGLMAQPVLDVAVVTGDIVPIGSVIESLKEMGYAHEGEVGQRQALRYDSGDPKAPGTPHRLSVCVEGNQELKRDLAFRDYLREHELVAAEYARQKLEFAARHPWDRGRYDDAKKSFATGVLGEAF